MINFESMDRIKWRKILQSGHYYDIDLYYQKDINICFFLSYKHWLEEKMAQAIWYNSCIISYNSNSN